MANIILTDKIVSDLKAKYGIKNSDKLAAYEVLDSPCKGLILRVEPSGTKTWWLFRPAREKAGSISSSSG